MLSHELHKVRLGQLRVDRQANGGKHPSHLRRGYGPARDGDEGPNLVLLDRAGLVDVDGLKKGPECLCAGGERRIHSIWSASAASRLWMRACNGLHLFVPGIEAPRRPLVSQLEPALCLGAPKLSPWTTSGRALAG